MGNLAYENYLNKLEELMTVVQGASIAQDKNGTYTGSRNSKGEPHGKGKMQFANGDVYEGDFVNGKLNGYGIAIFANGDRYTGNWTNGQMHGNGFFTYSNGSNYEGVWNNGKNIEKTSGNVKINITDECGNGVFEGVMKNGKPNGKGSAIYDNGTKYEGDWKDGKRNGKGKMQFPKSESDDRFSKLFWDTNYIRIQTYNGDWENGLPNGLGIYEGQVNPDNERVKYEGELTDGKPSGKGVFVYYDGDKYEGEWKKGLKHGNGKLKGTSIDIEGFWEDGSLKDGRGWKDNGCYYYEGEWKDFKFVYGIRKNDQIYEKGEFEGDVENEVLINGYLEEIEYYRNGYVGEIRNGRKVNGKMYYRNWGFKWIEGEFDDRDRLVGIGHGLHESGNIYTVECKSDGRYYWQ